MDLLIETCRADQVSPERRALLDAMYQREFGWDRLVYAAPEWYLMGNVGDSPVGRVGMLQRTITVGETSLPVGGITGVVTEPEWRGQGVASRLVRQAVRFLSDELGLQFGNRLFVFLPLPGMSNLHRVEAGTQRAELFEHFRLPNRLLLPGGPWQDHKHGGTNQAELVKLHGSLL